MTKYEAISALLLLISGIACILAFWTPLSALGGLMGIFVIIATPINAVLYHRHVKRKAKLHDYR